MSSPVHRPRRRPRAWSVAVLAALVPLLPAVGCAGAAPPEVSYVAQLLVSDASVSVLLVRVSVDSDGTVTQEPIGSRDLPIPGMRFSVDEGWVPASVTGLEAECYGRTDLGMDDAGPCFSGPLLGTFTPVLASLEVEKADVTVVVSYAMDDDEPYLLDDVTGLDERIGDYVQALGYRTGGGE